MVGSQDALILLRASFSAPRVQHLLRCSPSVDHSALTTSDDLLRSALNCLSRITNSDLTDTQSLQASLPIKDGGLGSDVLPRLHFQPLWHLLRAPSPSRTLSWLDMPAYTDSFFERFRRTWSGTFGTSPPAAEVLRKQSLWDRPGRRAFCEIKLQWNLAWSLVSSRPVSELPLPHTVVIGFMPYPLLRAVSVSMTSLFVWRWVCGWGVTFAFHMRAFVALRSMPEARMPFFANGRLAESPDIRL